jgi:SAM-dependent methyltransferase
VGLGSVFVGELAKLKRCGALNGFANVIEIGAQQLSNSIFRNSSEIDDLFLLYDRAVPLLGAEQAPSNGGGLPDNAPSSRVFWESLGFKYSALDFEGHRDSIAIDLNRDAVPPRLKGTFDLAVNTGTTEHVANQDNAFRVIHDLLKPGGIAMHEVPGPGMMTHGMFNYDIKFFWHLCRENEYEVLNLRVTHDGSGSIPVSIQDSNCRFGGYVVADVAVPNFMIRAALRKVHDRPFVTPLDIPVIIKSAAE